MKFEINTPFTLNLSDAEMEDIARSYIGNCSDEDFYKLMARYIPTVECLTDVLFQDEIDYTHKDFVNHCLDMNTDLDYAGEDEDWKKIARHFIKVKQMYNDGLQMKKDYDNQ